MLVSQVLIAFYTVRKHPGLDLEGLADKISSEYGDMEAARYMIHGDNKYSVLHDRISELNCVQERKGLFYFDSSIQPYSKDNIINLFIKNISEKENNPKAELRTSSPLESQ